MMSNFESTSATNNTRDWCFCFQCQSDLNTNPSTKKKSERTLTYYEKVIDNIRQLNELGELPNSIFTDDIVGVGADSDPPNIVQKMVANQVVWHKTCSGSIDTQKVQKSGQEVAISPVKN